MRPAHLPIMFAVFVVAFLWNALDARSQSSPSAVRWSEGAANAKLNVENGTRIETLTTDNVGISAGLREMEKTEYNRAWIAVVNRGKIPLDFHPEAITLVNAKGKTIAAENPEKTADSIQRTGEAQANEMASPNCTAMAGKTGMPGCQPTNTQVQVSKQILEFAGKQAEWARSNGLKTKTLAPNEQAQGAVFFKQEKKATDYILRIPIGSEVLEFPFSMPAHK
jgi:hypothetical protein